MNRSEGRMPAGPPPLHPPPPPHQPAVVAQIRLCIPLELVGSSPNPDLNPAPTSTQPQPQPNPNPTPPPHPVPPPPPWRPAPPSYLRPASPSPPPHPSPSLYRLAVVAQTCRLTEFPPAARRPRPRRHHRGHRCRLTPALPTPHIWLPPCPRVTYCFRSLTRSPLKSPSRD